MYLNPKCKKAQSLFTFFTTSRAKPDDDQIDFLI